MSLVGVYILMILGVLAAIFALECKRLIFSVIGLIVMNLGIWGTLLIYDAVLIAWIQLIVYGGGLTALFIVVVALTENQKDEAFDWKRSIVALVAVAVVVALLIVAVVLTGNFTISGIPASSLATLWTERTTDVLLQAILFFVTSIAIGALFLQHKMKQVKEETKA